VEREVKRTDEQYVIDLCDSILGLRAVRHAKFEFLRGDPGENGRCRKLPVDAHYVELKIVIEFQEKQQFESVLIMDRRPTCSGCDRGQQRKIYDQRRRDVLPRQGICLIELPYYIFPYDPNKRLRRISDADELVIRNQLRHAGIKPSRLL
jgi:hypothetical protein